MRSTKHRDDIPEDEHRKRVCRIEMSPYETPTITALAHGLRLITGIGPTHIGVTPDKGRFQDSSHGAET